MTAGEALKLVADAIRANFPGWTVVEGPNHDPLDHGIEVVHGGAEVIGHRAGRVAVRDQILIRLAVSTQYDYATVLAALDALALANTRIAKEAMTVEAQAGPLAIEGPSVIGDSGDRMFWYAEGRIQIERPIDPQAATTTLETIAQACRGTF